MTLKSTLRAGLILAAACFALATSGRGAQAEDRPDMRGDWMGFAWNEGQPAPSTFNPCFDIGIQQGRRLQGTLLTGLSPCFFPVDATLSERGTLDGAGREPDGDSIEFHGVVRAMADGSVRVAADGSVRIAAIEFKIRTRGGDTMQGRLLLLQMNGGPDWDRIAGFPLTGMWEGNYFPRGSRDGLPYMANLNNVTEGRDQPTTALNGTATFSNVFFPGPIFSDVSLSLQGTVGPPRQDGDGSVRTALIGADSNGIVAILIGLVYPPDPHRGTGLMIQGGYRLYASIDDVFAELQSGRSTAFNAGRFMIQPCF